MGRVATYAWLAALMMGPLSGSLAVAQEKEATPPGAEAEATPPGEAPAEAPGAAGAAPAEGGPAQQAAEQPIGDAYSDIQVVPRRAVLKRGRLEFMPTYNVTLNNPLVRHHGFGGQLNFYLTEALFIGVEGTYYQKQLTERYYLVGVDQRVLASSNRYNYSAFLDFGYVPVFGKFTLFDKAIAHWDVAISGGVGVMNTQIIPKDPAFGTFGGYRIAGLLPGISTHLWVTKWLALDAYVKNYIFSDALEPNGRTKDDCPTTSNCPASQRAISQFTFDLVFGVGMSFMLPAGYDYKTPR